MIVIYPAFSIYLIDDIQYLCIYSPSFVVSYCCWFFYFMVALPSVFSIVIVFVIIAIRTTTTAQYIKFLIKSHLLYIVATTTTTIPIAQFVFVFAPSFIIPVIIITIFLISFLISFIICLVPINNVTGPVSQPVINERNSFWLMTHSTSSTRRNHHFFEFLNFFS